MTTSPASPVELSDDVLLHLRDTHVGEPSARYPLTDADWINFARAAVMADRAREGSAVAVPVAFVPVHPRSGPLWQDTYDAKDAENIRQRRPMSYPHMALYDSPQLRSSPLTDAEIDKAIGIESGRNVSLEMVLRSVFRAAEVAHGIGVATPPAAQVGTSGASAEVERLAEEHHAEVKATLEGLHSLMESLCSPEIYRRLGPAASHARGYTHKITAALRHLDRLATLSSPAQKVGTEDADAQATSDETAWLFEYDGTIADMSVGSTAWACVKAPSIAFGKPEVDWTHDVNKALRFSRREDAEAFRVGYLGQYPRPWDVKAYTITEHMWPAPQPPEATPVLEYSAEDIVATEGKWFKLGFDAGKKHAVKSPEAMAPVKVAGEPVAWQVRSSAQGTWGPSTTKRVADYWAELGYEVRPLYAAPQPCPSCLPLGGQGIPTINPDAEGHTEGVCPDCGSLPGWMRKPHLTDSELSELFDGCDFASMVTADDLFYIIARAVEKRVLAGITTPAGKAAKGEQS